MGPKAIESINDIEFKRKIAFNAAMEGHGVINKILKNSDDEALSLESEPE